MENRNNNLTSARIRIIVVDAMLIAMYTALSLFDIKIGNAFKISIATLPVLVGGLLFGPLHGFVIGFAGCFINQMIVYGFMAATMLYVGAYAITGLVAGLMASMWKYEYSPKRIAVISVISTSVLTILNTVAIYLQSHWEGWYSSKLVFGSLVGKFVKNIILSAAYTILLPPILREARRILLKTGEEQDG